MKKKVKKKVNSQTKTQRTSPSAIIFMLFSALFASAGQIFFKFAANGTNDFATFVFNPFLYSGLAAYGLGVLLMIKAMRRGELTVIYPILATSFIWVSITSPLFFNADSMSLQKWFGVLIIILGISCIGKGRQK